MKGFNISQNDVKGNVVVIGPGTMFPEAVLVFSPESNFRKFRKKVDSVTLCDSEDYFLTLNIDMPNLKYFEQLELAHRGECGFVWTHFEHFLFLLEGKSVNTILMFEMPDEFEDFIIRQDVSDQISRVLANNGTFIGTSSFFSGDESHVSSMLPSVWRLETYTRLPDKIGVYPFHNHHIRVHKS